MLCSNHGIFNSQMLCMYTELLNNLSLQASETHPKVSSSVVENKDKIPSADQVS